MFSFTALKKSNFIKHVSVILSGSIVAQLITITSTPILTRTYGTESFGVFGLFMTLTSIFSTFSSGRYNMAVMLPRQKEDALNIIVLTCLLSLITGVILTILIPFSDQFSEMLGAPALSAYIVWLPVVVVINDWFQVISNWVGRNKGFFLIAIAMVAGAVFGNGWRIGAGFFDSSAQGLIFGSLLVFSVQLLVLLFKEWTKLKILFIQSFNYHTMKKLAARYRQLPYYRAPKDLLNSLSQNAPTLMLSFYFSANKVGLFYLVDRILRAPSALVGNAVRRVYFQKSTEIYNNGGSLFPATIKTTGVLALFGFLPFSIIAMFGPYIFGYIFGPDWVDAGEYARWIAILTFFYFINVPSVVVIPILELEKYFLYYEIVSITLRVGTLFYGGVLLNNDVKAIMLYCLLGSLLEIIFIVYILAKTKMMIVNDSSK